MGEVSFTRLEDGTEEDFKLLTPLTTEVHAELPDRLMREIQRLPTEAVGYQLDCYHHSLQTATRARRDGRDDEYVAMCLIHDVGVEVAPYNHGEYVATMLTPFVRPEVSWIAGHHGLFQMYYYAHFYGLDRNGRDAYRDNEWFDGCVEFCELYDSPSFDPEYDTLPMEAFEPLMREVFGDPRYLNR